MKILSETKVIRVNCKDVLIEYMKSKGIKGKIKTLPKNHWSGYKFELNY